MKSPFNIIFHLENLNRVEDDLAAHPETPHAALALCREIRALLPVELLEAHDQIRLSGNRSVAAMLYRHCGACSSPVDPVLLCQPRLAGLFVACPHCKTLLYEMQEGCGELQIDESTPRRDR
jgi:predicted  nucleic acid-binding Zn-ribbon protein